MKEMVKKCVVFVYLCNLDLSIPCAPLEPVKKLTNKQTNKREKLKKETMTKNKETKQNKQTKRNKDVTEGRLLLIFFNRYFNIFYTCKSASLSESCKI